MTGKELAVSLCLSLSIIGCTDAGSRLDDFDDNVIDATVVEDFDAPPLDTLPDVSGTFYSSMTAEIAPTSPFHFRFEFDMTQHPDGTGSVDVEIVSLTTAERVPVGETLVVDDVPITANGEMLIPVLSTVPGDANPLSSNDVGLDIELDLTIRDTETICGVANGMTTAPIELDVSGSIVINVRVAPGTTGDDLPPPRTDCPDSTIPDAGPADAMVGPPDAGTPDAPVPDAAVPDAATPDA